MGYANSNVRFSLGPVAKFRWSAWLGPPLDGPAIWNYPAPPTAAYH